MTMNAPVKINVNQKQKRAVELSLIHIKNGAGKALMRAVNHTLNKTKTEAGREIRKQINMPAKDVRERLKVRRATISNTSGAVLTPRRGNTLTRYWVPEGQAKTIGFNKVSFFKAPEAPEEGPQVQVKPRGATKRMPGAFFIGPMPGSGAILMVKRVKHGPGLGRSGGLKVYYGPSISQVFTDVKDDLMVPQSDHFNSRLMHEANRLLQGH